MLNNEQRSEARERRRRIAGNLLYVLPALLLLLLIVIFRNRLTHIITPLLISVVAYFFLEPAVKTLETKCRVKRTAAIFTVFACSFILITAIVAFIAPIVKNNIKDIVLNLPVLKEKLLSLGVSIADRLGINLSALPNDCLQGFFAQKFADIAEKAETWAISGSYMNIVYGIVDMFSAIVITFYLLRDREQIGEWLMGLFPYNWREFLHETAADIGKISSSFIRGQLVIALIVGTIETVGLWLIGSKYPVVFGIIGGISNIIPYFGPFIGAVPAVIAAFMVSPVRAVWTAILFVAVQQIDNNFISPKIIEGRLGIHPVTTIIVVFTAGEFFGIAGILLGIPVYAIIRCVIKKISGILVRKNSVDDSE